MITLIFYFVWMYLLDKDDDLSVIGIYTSIIDGVLIYGLIYDFIIKK